MLIADTERLLLRHFLAADLDDMAGLFADAEVMRFGTGPQTREWTQKWLSGCLEDYYQKWGFGLWAIVPRVERRVIGFCGLTLFPDVDGREEIELGYRLARSYWGRGFATEAVGAVRDYAFDILCLRRLIALIDPENVRSVRVAEKSGFRPEKDILFRGKPVRVYAARGEATLNDVTGESERSTP
jgi:ribosomal-protein-alanine N-acetyltransferase